MAARPAEPGPSRASEGALVRYRVDAGDRIAWVGPRWLAFARANESPDLTPEAVVGRPLLEFVAGRETVQLYRMVLDRARTTGRHLKLPFRCDGPAVRRYMELLVSPLRDGELQFAARTIREEPRDPAELLDASVPRSSERVVVCSWCKRVRAGDWVEVEVAVERLHLFDAIRLPAISHGICAECEAQVLEELEAAG